MNIRNQYLVILLLLLTVACNPKKETTSEEKQPEGVLAVTKKSYATMPDGKEVFEYTLRNKSGVEAKVINYGGIVTSLMVPDKDGNMGDVVLGYDSLSSYLKSNPYFGALIGRYGNRIGKGKFSLDGTTYTLPINDGPNHLHGGPAGFDKVYWNIAPVEDSTKAALTLTYHSVDGEQGYPGNLDVEVTYTLTDENELKVDYKATTDKKTIINLTQHSYFNLTGDPTKDILGHELMIDAAYFLPVDKTLIPTGELKPVKDTPFDFNVLTSIGARIDNANEQLQFGKGYDHCWILNGYDSTTLRKVATLYDSTSGRVMDVITTEPGLQFYSGNFLDGTLIGKNNITYQYRHGLCLETQHYPDSPNKPEFPAVTLMPGETYSSTTIYKFSTK